VEVIEPKDVDGSQGAESRRILCFATQGEGHLDAERLHYLLRPLGPVLFAFDHDRKLGSAVRLARTVIARRPDLVVMEGTGWAGGITLLLLRSILRVPYIVSSGDAVGPYLRLHSRLAGAVGAVYERLLCRFCAGYIGWTPYLVGRAITFGAPRAMTAPGWTRRAPSSDARERVRARLGVDDRTLLVGIVGTLEWNANVGYSYGLELVRAARAAQRDDLVACIVGDGSARARLEALAGDDLGSRIIFTGRVSPEEVADYLAAFDLASLPQSVDGVGAFRYSTKLSEYLGAGLAILTNQIPAAYDLDEGFFFRLAGDSPWSTEFADALADLFKSLTGAEVSRRRDTVARWQADAFDARAQQRRVSAFIEDILA
jgi:glycosyltransferase involved in cell wall biosynthesis